MTDNIIIDGIELVRVTEALGKADKHTQKCNARIIGHRDLHGITGLKFIDGMLTSDDGPVYATPGRRLVTAKQIEAVYPGMVPENA